MVSGTRGMIQEGTPKCQPVVEQKGELIQHVRSRYVTPVWSNQYIYGPTKSLVDKIS